MKRQNSHTQWQTGSLLTKFSCQPKVKLRRQLRQGFHSQGYNLHVNTRQLDHNVKSLKYSTGKYYFLTTDEITQFHYYLFRS